MKVPMEKRYMILAAVCVTLLIAGSVFGVLYGRDSLRASMPVTGAIVAKTAAFGDAVQEYWAGAYANVAERPVFEWSSMPKIEWLTLPEISLPESEMPTIELPSVPEISLPEWQWPDLQVAERLQAFGQSVAQMFVAASEYVTQGFWVGIDMFSSVITQPLPQPLSVSLFDLPAALQDPGLAMWKRPASEEAEIVLAKVKQGSNLTVQNDAVEFQDIEPASGEIDALYDIEQKILDVEGVLVPQASTVISSSRDGQIAKINFENGDMFQKGDILVEYACKDIKAEMAVAKAEKELATTRFAKNEKLLKLDIISDIEHLGIKAEEVKASAQASIVESEIEKCYIRAAYDGRVTNRLANAHEFTRTDRVLMEVASLDDLDMEFLIPSRWLRWVNVDAPITIAVEETGEQYSGVIQRIHGEVDPVSQSIQVSAKLDAYEAPLLPGMSGTVQIDVEAIRAAGILGFLEEPRYAKRDTNE